MSPQRVPSPGPDRVPSTDEIARAAELLRRGRLVAFPTETVYGLGADATNPSAVRRLFAVKGRPADHPLIVHLPEGAVLGDWALEVPERAERLAAACWPGPLTLVLRRKPGRIAGEVTGGLDTVGLRVPGHPVALALLAAFGGAIAAPSANRFGRVSPTTAADVRADLGDDVDLVLDGGPCRVGVESTIVDCTADPPAILRLGGVGEERLARILGCRPARRTGGEVAAPGTLEVHYAPAAHVEVVTPGEVAARAAAHLARSRRVGLLAPAPPGPPPDGVVVLDPPAGAEEYARVLYARLREADRLGLEVLLAVPPPDEGLGAAVADRLRRAAARR